MAKYLKWDWTICYSEGKAFDLLAGECRFNLCPGLMTFLILWQQQQWQQQQWWLQKQQQQSQEEKLQEEYEHTIATTTTATTATAPPPPPPTPPPTPTTTVVWPHQQWCKRDPGRSSHRHAHTFSPCHQTTNCNLGYTSTALENQTLSTEGSLYRCRGKSGFHSLQTDEMHLLVYNFTRLKALI